MRNAKKTSRTVQQDKTPCRTSQIAWRIRRHPMCKQQMRMWPDWRGSPCYWVLRLQLRWIGGTLTYRTVLLSQSYFDKLEPWALNPEPWTLNFEPYINWHESYDRRKVSKGTHPPLIPTGFPPTVLCSCVFLFLYLKELSSFQCSNKVTTQKLWTWLRDYRSTFADVHILQNTLPASGIFSCGPISI